MDKFNDEFIADAIIKSDFLLNKYDSIIKKIHVNEFTIDEPKSDMDPYYIISLNEKNSKIKFKASYIGKLIIRENNVYIKWSWSDTKLSKASKVNLLKILKYFLDREPEENSPVLNQIYEAFIQSIIKVDQRFTEVILNALLHLMKHLFYIRVKVSDDIENIYFIKEIN
jgi:flagellin-specific chaperone FliS